MCKSTVDTSTLECKCNEGVNPAVFAGYLECECSGWCRVDGEDTLVESPSNDEQQMLKLAYMMGQTTEQKLSEHLRNENGKLEAALKKIAGGTLEPGHLYDQSVRMQDIARAALADRP